MSNFYVCFGIIAAWITVVYLVESASHKAVHSLNLSTSLSLSQGLQQSGFKMLIMYQGNAKAMWLIEGMSRALGCKGS